MGKTGSFVPVTVHMTPGQAHVLQLSLRAANLMDAVLNWDERTCCFVLMSSLTVMDSSQWGFVRIHVMLDDVCTMFDTVFFLCSGLDGSEAEAFSFGLLALCFLCVRPWVES